MPTPSSPLQVRRSLAGFSLRTLSQATGITQTKIHYYEHGLRIPPRDLVRLADALGCAPNDLLEAERSDV
jgi:DNA-binding Xre family transcriptional regulator